MPVAVVAHAVLLFILCLSCNHTHNTLLDQGEIIALLYYCAALRITPERTQPATCTCFSGDVHDHQQLTGHCGLKLLHCQDFSKSHSHVTVSAAAPIRKNGWAVRTQPSVDVNRSDGNTVQMLRQTWDASSGNARMPGNIQGQQALASPIEAPGRLQAQLQASIEGRRDRFSHQ